MGSLGVRVADPSWPGLVSITKRNGVPFQSAPDNVQSASTPMENSVYERNLGPYIFDRNARGQDPWELPAPARKLTAKDRLAVYQLASPSGEEQQYSYRKGNVTSPPLGIKGHQGWVTPLGYQWTEKRMTWPTVQGTACALQKWLHPQKTTPVLLGSYQRLMPLISSRPSPQNKIWPSGSS